MLDAFERAVRPRAVPRFETWMDENFVTERGGILVPWQTSLTPYWRLVMADLDIDSETEEIVIDKPSQVGASELLVGLCIYLSIVAPGIIIMCRPDLEEAARFKRLRFDTALEHCRAKHTFRESKSREPGNTKHDVLFDGGGLELIGGNSPAGLASTPAPYFFVDELDRLAAGAGAGGRAEGDQYELGKMRTVTFQDVFPRRKLIRVSSPGDAATSKIEPAWQASNRSRYWVPCHECGTPIVFDFTRLWWPHKGDPRSARYRCQACDRLLDERAKPEMLAAGEWRAAVVDPVHGYRLNGLDSPFMTWGALAKEWEAAKGFPHKMRVFVNTKKAEVFDSEEATKVDAAKLKLLACKVDFVDGQPVIPTGVGTLTSGTDMQPFRLETSLKGWGRGEECWWIDHVIFPGDVTTRQPWNDLDTYLLSTWQNDAGRSFRMAAGCVDTGGETPVPAYDFVRNKAHRRILGIKGKGGSHVKPWPRKPSRTQKSGGDLYVIGVDAFKSQLYARLKDSVERAERGERGGPGFIHIAAHLCEDIENPDGSREPSEYLKQLVSEVTKVVSTRTGLAKVWDLPSHTRNETLDCDVYAQAALYALKALRMRIDATVTPGEAVQPIQPTRAPLGGTLSQSENLTGRDGVSRVSDQDRPRPESATRPIQGPPSIPPAPLKVPRYLG